MKITQRLSELRKICVVELTEEDIENSINLFLKKNRLITRGSKAQVTIEMTSSGATVRLEQILQKNTDKIGN